MFIENYIGILRTTGQERTRYGIQKQRLADSDIYESIVKGQAKPVLRYILDKVWSRPNPFQVMYQHHRFVSIEKRDMYQALIDLLKLLQYPQIKYETYDFPHLFKDSSFQKIWYTYIRNILFPGDDLNDLRFFIENNRGNREVMDALYRIALMTILKRDVDRIGEYFEKTYRDVCADICS